MSETASTSQRIDPTALYAMTHMKEEMQMQQKTLTATRAMHEKQTKQLVDLVHLREDRLQLAKQATATTMSSVSRTEPIKKYDIHT